MVHWSVPVSSTSRSRESVETSVRRPLMTGGNENVDGGHPVVVGDDRRVLAAHRVVGEDLAGRHLGVAVQRHERVAVGLDAGVGDAVRALARRRLALEHRQVVDADGALRALAAHRRVELLLELDERLQPGLRERRAPDDRPRDVRPVVGDGLVDDERPVGGVGGRDVHPAVVAVLVPERAGDALDREPVETVRRELELERPLVGLALVLEAEREQVRPELVVTLLVVAGEPAELVGIDLDDGHQ